jgi:hypothetical protein
MEKTIVFGPIIIFFGFFGLLVIGFIALIIKLISKSKNEEWTGIIVDKKHNQVEDDESGATHDYYYLVVKMDTGKERKVGLSGTLWSDFKVGDRLKKPKGKLFPQII